MKPSTLAIAALIAAAAPMALASTASEREYQRGYNDCSQGRYDQNQHGESYKKGCRAAEDEQEESSTRAGGGLREASGNAESACMSAVNSRFDGKVNDIVVTSSEFSQANDLVMLKAGGQTWKCLVSDDGQVQELSVVGR
jgi:opacity protein-like surface antigen